jgi:hypothetical protein
VRERQKIQGLLDQIRQVGMKSGRSNDSIMVQKLEAKLTELENKRQNMKAVNAYHRHHKTLDGYTDIHPSFIQKLKNNMSRNEQADTKPFSDSDLSRNSAKIYRIKSKIQELTEHQETIFRGWQFGGGSIKANTEDNRLQIFFDIKPDAATRMDMKKNGFRWAPRVGAWQRPLNKKAIEAADRIERIRPIAQKENTEWDNQNGNNGSRDENEREQEP